MVASAKLLHLLEAFSTPWFLFSSPNNHHLVFFLLEMFNNIIQYQFDGKYMIFGDISEMYSHRKYLCFSLSKLPVVAKLNQYYPVC